VKEMKNIQIFTKLTSVFIVASLLQSCVSSVVTSGAQAAYQHRNLQHTLHDHYIAIQVDRAIHWSSGKYSTSRIAISTFNNIVILTGQVPSKSLRDNLTSIAKQVPDVDVVYNLTTINSPASTLAQISDSWITTKIKTQLIAANEIDPDQIKVITENGTVFLIGTVFPEQANIATDIARTTDGTQNVVKVFSYLHVSKSPANEAAI
jgi:osmotically-inducible protein OsmY